jgi:hypothetical protein
MKGKRVKQVFFLRVDTSGCSGHEERVEVGEYGEGTLYYI